MLPQRYLVQATSQRMWATWSIGLVVLGQFSRAVFLCHFASVLDKNSSWHGSGCKLRGVKAVCLLHPSSSLRVVRHLFTHRGGHTPQGQSCWVMCYRGCGDYFGVKHCHLRYGGWRKENSSLNYHQLTLLFHSAALDKLSPWLKTYQTLFSFF